MIFYKKSSYLTRMVLKYLVFFVVVMLIGIVLVYLTRPSSDSSDMTKNIWLGIVFASIPAWFLFSQVFKKIAHRYDRGRFGEKQVKQILKQLSDDFVVIQNLPIKKHGDVDFVVIGPTGVFTVEAKRYRVPTTEQIKKFAHQAKHEAVMLSNIIQSKTGQKIWVKPILVFVDLKRKIDLDFIGDVQVVTGDYLIKAIWTDKSFTYQNRQAVVESLVKL